MVYPCHKCKSAHTCVEPEMGKSPICAKFLEDTGVLVLPKPSHDFRPFRTGDLPICIYRSNINCQLFQMCCAKFEMATRYRKDSTNVGEPCLFYRRDLEWVPPELHPYPCEECKHELWCQRPREGEDETCDRYKPLVGAPKAVVKQPTIEREIPKPRFKEQRNPFGDY